MQLAAFAACVIFKVPQLAKIAHGKAALSPKRHTPRKVQKAQKGQVYILSK